MSSNIRGTTPAVIQTSRWLLLHQFTIAENQNIINLNNFCLLQQFQGIRTSNDYMTIRTTEGVTMVCGRSLCPQFVIGCYIQGGPKSKAEFFINFDYKMSKRM